VYQFTVLLYDGPLLGGFNVAIKGLNILEHDHPSIPMYKSAILNDTVDHVTFWINLSLRPKIETKPFNFGLSPEFKLTNHARRTSLLTP